LVVGSPPTSDAALAASEAGADLLGTFDSIAAEEKRNTASAEVVASAPIVGKPTLAGTLYIWLLSLWAAGAVVVGGRYVLRTVRFGRYARSGKAASASLERQVMELATRLGMRAPLVRVLPDLVSPVVWCLWRPVLLWPKGLQDRLSAEGRQAVLVHELAHLRRRDHWVRWLELAAAVIHWWNPLFWLVRRQLRFHAELACDAWVTGTLPDARRAYAEALLEVCARSTRAAAPSPAVGVGGDGRRDFERRLTMIMSEKAPCRLAAGARMFVVLLAMAALPAWTLGQAKPDAKPEGKPVEVQGIFELQLDGKGAAKGEVKDVLLWAEVDAGKDAKAKELEAKIAELTKQLESLKALKAAATKIRETKPLRFDAVETKQGVLIYTIDAATGKIIESRETPKPLGVKVDTVKPKDGEHGLKIVIEGNEARLIGAPGGDTKGPNDAKVRVVVVGADGKPVDLKNPGAAARFEHKLAPQVKVIGPDGKEIKGAKVFIDGKEYQSAPPPLPKGAPLQLELKNFNPLPFELKDIKGRLHVEPNDGKPLEIELKLDDAHKQLETARARLAAVRTITADAARGSVMTLTRATYKLPKDKATTLASFLKDNIKASVLEVKVEGDSLTVTTTPEAQNAIGTLVKLIDGPSGEAFRNFYRMKLGEEKK
jgi:beta-lactamase regulating signal transducer with metallopeptidase domain